MRSKVFGLVAPLLVCGSLSGHAAMITPLGSLGPPGVTTFGDAFSGAGSFADIYTFNVGSSADLLALTLALDFSPSLNISIGSPQLFSGTPGGSSAVVAALTGCTSVVCSWDVASAGNYFLEIAGNVDELRFFAPRFARRLRGSVCGEPGFCFGFASSASCSASSFCQWARRNGTFGLVEGAEDANARGNLG